MRLIIVAIDWILSFLLVLILEEGSWILGKKMKGEGSEAMIFDFSAP